MTAIGSQNVGVTLAHVLDVSLIELAEWDGTRAELEALIESGELSVALIVPEGFADAVDEEISAELAVQGRFRQIGDVRRHAGDGQALVRAGLVFAIIAAVPVGIDQHGLAAHFVKGDVLS